MKEGYAEGKYPSEHRVAKFLTHPSFLRYPQVREVFKQAKRDLGLES
ncbi:MAG: hypothetical protein QNJ37_25095 [Crocosphaera sp.]|nr:hypothetical protein [Crocosphaera sp.]